MAPISSSRKSPCPICGDGNGQCKITDKGALCANTDQAPPGWRYNGPAKRNSQWHQFAPLDPNAIPAPVAGSKKSELPPYPQLDRRVLDRLFRQIIAAGSLDPLDRAALHARGFGDKEIAAAGFTTIRAGDDLGVGTLPDGFPGRARGARSIWFGTGDGEPIGILCPIPDCSGLIVGAQVRLRNAAGGRYRWVSSRRSPAAIDGENPLPLILGSQGDSLPVAICEGTGFKPRWLAIHRGHHTIGTAGHMWLSSPSHLRAALESSGARDRGVVIFPDGGARANLKVKPDYDALIRQIQEWGIAIHGVGDWGQWREKIGDIDEIPADQEIEFRPIQDWLGGEAMADSSAAVKEGSQGEAIAIPGSSPSPEPTPITLPPLPPSIPGVAAANIYLLLGDEDQKIIDGRERAKDVAATCRTLMAWRGFAIKAQIPLEFDPADWAKAIIKNHGENEAILGKMVGLALPCAAPGFGPWKDIQKRYPTTFRAIAPMEVRRALVALSSPPSAAEIVQSMGTPEATGMAWDPSEARWYRVEGGTWEPAQDVIVSQVIQNHMQAIPESAFSGWNERSVSSVASLAKSKLVAQKWSEGADKIPFANGVLSVESLTLRPHDPGNWIRWKLPYPYREGTNCPKIEDWLYEANGGHHDRVQLLRAFANAVLTGRAPTYQKFLEIVGPGGTGKSTFTKLLTAVVGYKNVCATDLSNLETNRFEVARLRGKRLAVIADAEAFGGAADKLKSLVAADDLRCEEKYVQQSETFQFGGGLIISANQPFASSDSSSGLQRRRITIPFTVRPEAKNRRELIGFDADNTPKGEFADELPHFVNWCLAMPEKDVRAYLLNTAEMVPSLAREAREILVETNPILSWLDECCVIDPDALAPLKSGEGNLYDSYVKYCQSNGARPLSSAKFTRAIIDGAANQLGAAHVRKVRRAMAMMIAGIGLRSEGDALSPRPVTAAAPLTARDAELSDRAIAEKIDAIYSDHPSNGAIVQAWGVASTLPEIRRNAIYHLLPESTRYAIKVAVEQHLAEAQKVTTVPAN